MEHRIRTGIGGWTFEPWRGGSFYPEDLPHARELHWASRQLPAIEINGTYYRNQKPSTFAKWRDDTPGGFMFSVKALKYCTLKKVLGDAGELLQGFLKSGVTELAEKLGPIVWEFAPGRVFDPTDFAAFLALLPARQDGVALRHVLEVRHPSFQDPAFVALARDHGCAIVFTDSDKFPNIDENTADFNYARLLMASPDQPRGYSDPALDGWAEKARQWADGNRRDVFVFFINGAKERAPAAAGALLGRLGLAPLA